MVFNWRPFIAAKDVRENDLTTLLCRRTDGNRSRHRQNWNRWIWFDFFFAPPMYPIYTHIHFRLVTKKYRVHLYVRHCRTVVLHAQLHIIILYFINASIMCIIYKRVPTPPTVAVYLLLYYIIYISKYVYLHYTYKCVCVCVCVCNRV